MTELDRFIEWLRATDGLHSADLIRLIALVDKFRKVQHGTE